MINSEYTNYEENPIDIKDVSTIRIKPGKKRREIKDLASDLVYGEVPNGEGTGLEGIETLSIKSYPKYDNREHRILHRAYNKYKAKKERQEFENAPLSEVKHWDKDKQTKWFTAQMNKGARTVLPAVLGVATLPWTISAAVTAPITTALSIGGGLLGSKIGGDYGRKIDIRRHGYTNYGDLYGTVGGLFGGALGGFTGSVGDAVINIKYPGVLPPAKNPPINTDFGNYYNPLGLSKGDFAAKMLMENIDNTVLSLNSSTIAPKMIFKLGDVEINNPNLYYRQGSRHMGDHFLRTGIVSAGDTNHLPAVKVNGIQLTRKETFRNPMFSKGHLWYGENSRNIPDLLVGSGADKFQPANKYSNPTSNISSAGSRRIPVGTLGKDDISLYRYVPGYGYMKMNPQVKTASLEFMQRPSKLTIAEKMGLPKSVRKSLTQDQLDALSDTYQYITSGRHRSHLYYDANKDVFVRAGSVHSGVPAHKALLDHGAVPGRTALSSTSLNMVGGNYHMWPGRQGQPAVFTGGKFPKPEGMGWAPGDLTINLGDNSGKHLKMIMTAPRTDYTNSVIEGFDQTVARKLPNTIDKNIVRTFWTNNDKMVLPGSYLSGDTAGLPLGHSAISAIDDGLGNTHAINKIVFNKGYSTPHRDGLSPDSYSSIIRQGNRPGHSLRWGQGFTNLNNSAVENAHIYNAYSDFLNKKITAAQFKNMFDDWSISLGGRPLEIKTINGVETPVFPHPYIYYKQHGGKLKWKY